MTTRARIILCLLLAFVPGLVLFGLALWLGNQAQAGAGLAGSAGPWLPAVALLLHVAAFMALSWVVYSAYLRPLPKIQMRAHAIAASTPAFAEIDHLASGDLNALAGALGVLEQQMNKQRTVLAEAEARHAQAVREIHHRIKNNLQVVSSLLSLQATRLKVPAGRADFDMARQRLSALALLHRHLYDGEDFETIALRPFCDDLIAHLRELAGYERTAPIRTQIEIPQIRVTADQAVLIGLIITEAVTNSFRHAFPGNRPGKIAITMAVDQGRAKLVIADDGIGLPAGRLTGTGVDLGGVLIAGFVSQLRGKMAVLAQDGTRLEIDFPLDPVDQS